MSYNATLGELNLPLKLSGQERFFADLSAAMENAGNLMQDSLGGAVDQAGGRMLQSIQQTGHEMERSLSEAVNGSVTAVFKGETDELEDIWSQTWQEMSRGLDGALSGMTDSVEGIFMGGLDDCLDFLGDEMQSAFTRTAGQLDDSLTQTLSGSVTAIFRGDLDEVGDIWEMAWADMGNSLEGMWGDLVDGLFKDLAGGLNNMLDNLLVDPLTGWIKDSLITPAVKGIGSFGESTLNFLGVSTAGGGSAAAGGAAMGSGGAIAGTAAGAGALVAGITGGSVAGGVGAGAGMTGGVTFGSGAGIAGGSGLGAAAAGALAPAGAFLGAAAAYAGLAFGIAELTGIGTGGYSKEEAQEAIAADKAYLERAVGKQESWAGPEFLGRIQETVTEMDRLAGTTGYTERQIDAMVDSLGDWGSAMAEGGQAAGMLEHTIEGLIRNFESQADSTRDMDRTVKDFSGSLDNLSAYVFEASSGAVDLGGTFRGLMAEFEAGGITLDEMGEKLNQEVSLALGEAADQGSLTTEEMRKLSKAIKDIPKSWQSDITVTKHETTIHHDVFKNIDQHHSGGLVMHAGGLVPRRFHAGSMVDSLAWDEVPIIARRGEYVVRAESVTASTLPGLKALNQSGGGAGRASGIVINSPLINIEGNLLGSDDNFEDLVRAVESKLREVAGIRQGV